jgi:hypothetical protein
MDNQTLQKLRDAITKSNAIGVAVAPNPSLDQMAAALSLSMLLKEANKTAAVAAPTDPIVEISNLVGINKVQKSLGGGSGSAGDLIVSFPYLEGEIEKVSYTLENGFLNIIVKASEQGLSFNEKDVQYKRGGGGRPLDLLFVIGAQSLNDISSVVNQQNLQNAQIVNIDNKETNQGFGTIVLVSPQALSVCELIGDIALSLGFKIERDAAQNMMSGLITATQNFQNPRTSSLAFEVASYLMRRGAARTAPHAEVQPGQENFAQQFLNRPAPQPQPKPQQQPQAMPQPQFQPAPQPTPQPAQQSAPQPAMSAADRQEELRQQLRDQENLRNGGQQPQQGPQQEKQNQQSNNQQDEAAPVDWLTPKVYKGSSNF